ncbi:FAD/NAD(P)-binding domain-containing protein [Athelia psychrophila]|uniref:FAD/NAD(P)-binding domain-containing protein n=1 Tax=Athelia psychrophila TaxID=1759441 RepID=A0A166CYM1_9AGAM|nr:FAD/NAD(P)-binding domain-containing protein [Fibularhizoctonia sp. CBS 109695]
MECVDVIILGTGLTESITAAALSKAGFKVAHIDVNPYYGSNEASLSVDELVQWATERSSGDHDDAYLQAQAATFPYISTSASTLPQSRQYAISLAPSIIPSIGPLISSLISSGVARYGGYRLLERVGIYESGKVRDVPGSKEDVFKNKDISLVDKRRLMRFLVFAASEFEDSKELAGKGDVPFVEFLRATFSLKDNLASVIAYALAFCVVASEPTLPALRRIRSYLRAGGRYGSSPFLVGHYGGAGEIAQGFCRVAAVAGGIYILGKRVMAVQTVPPNTSVDAQPTSGEPVTSFKYTVELEDLPEKLSCNVIISSADLLPPELRPSAPTHVEPPELPVVDLTGMLRCIAIIDSPMYFAVSSQTPQGSRSEEDGSTSLPDDNSHGKIDTAVIVFPPASLPGGSTSSSVQAMITGESSMSTPSGKWIIYISMLCCVGTTGTPETMLNPYLEAILGLTVSAPTDPPLKPLFTTYYSQVLPAADTLHDGLDPSVLVSPSPQPFLSEISDSTADKAEALFWKAISALKSFHYPQVDGIEAIWPSDTVQEGEDQDE